MKNKNLLNWLWTDSHEKQSPQRFARFAAILIMLLTLGVGQMWAENYIEGDAGLITTGWNIKGYRIDNTPYNNYAVAAGKYNFKITDGNSESGGSCFGTVTGVTSSNYGVTGGCMWINLTGINDVNITWANSGWNVNITVTPSSYFIKYPWGDNHAWTFSAPMTACSDGTYACTGPYNGTTYDFGRRGYDGGAGAKTAQTATVNNSPSTDETCVFNVTTSGALTITRCNKVTATNKIYFDNSVSNFTGNIYLIIGHDKPTKYSCAYKMTQLAGTKLHYVSVGANWTDATYYAIVGNSAASISAGSWGSESLSTKQTGGYTAAYTGKYDFDGSNKQYLLTTSSSGNGQALTITYKNTGYSNLNYTQSVTLCTKAYGAATYSANTSSLTSLNFTTYNLTGVGSVSTQQTNNMNGSTGVASGSACQAATTIINVGDAPASWVYDGIYTAMNGGSQVEDDQEYTYYPRTATNYYVRFHEVHDPSVSLAASSAYLTTTGGLRALKDEVITLTATATYTAGSPVRYTYEYSTNGGSTWNSIASSVTSASQTYTPTTTGDYKFRVTLPNETGTPSAITNVHVTKMYTINVKKNSSWTPSKLYIWNKSTEITQYGAFPGATGKFTNRGQWYSFELNSDFDSFIISASEHTSNHTTDVNNVTSDGCYTINAGTGTSVGVTSGATCPSIPTATTNDADNITSTSVVFNYSVSANQDNTTPGVAFMQSDDDVEAATIYSSGTKVSGSVITGGNVSGSTAAQTIIPGKKYYYVAYGTNGFGTGYGVVKSFVAPYKVTVSTNTGCAEITNSGVNYTNSTITVTATAATGYEFSSWSTTNGTQTSTSSEGNTNTLVFTPTAEDATIRPVYTPIVYDITLDDQDATSEYHKTALTIKYNGTYFEDDDDQLYPTPESPDLPYKSGYHFQGWYTGIGGAGLQIMDAGGQLQSNKAGYSDSEGKWIHTEDITLYAKWLQSSEYGYLDILLNNNGGAGGQVVAIYNSNTLASFTASTRTGYIFQGYFTAAEGGNKIINADGSIVAGNVTGFVTDGKWTNSSLSAEIFAQWVPITYTIAFAKNNDASYYGSETGDNPTPIAATYDVNATMPENTYSRTGYHFIGWSTEAHKAKGSCPGVDYDYAAGGTARNLTSTQGATVTLYPKWLGNTHTISFNARGGYVSQTSSNITFDETYGSGTGLYGNLPIPTPPSGYEFSGWYSASEGGTEVTKDDKMHTDGDHTLYAHYVRKDRVYFKNTLGWTNVYVTWDAEWNHGGSDKGAGASGKTQELMNHIYGTDIWYKDIPAAILSDWAYNIAFTSKAMDNYEWFDDGEAVFRRDFDKKATMFVPKPNDSNKFLKNTHDSKPGTLYYSTDQAEGDPQGRYKNGYWVKYNDLQAGYDLKGSWNWVEHHYIERPNPEDSVYIFTIQGLSANTTYEFKLYKDAAENTTGTEFSSTTSITSATAPDAAIFNAADGGSNASMKTTVAGDYTFKFNFSALGEVKLTVDYPFAVNDYKVVYSYTKDGAKTFESQYIKARANGIDTISMFIHSGDSATDRSLAIHKCTAISVSGVDTWNTSYASIALPAETASGKTSGVYNIQISLNESSAATGECVGRYEGQYYIRSQAADGGWDQYKVHADNLMTLSEYSLKQTLSAPYSHYFCKYIDNSTTEVTFTIATDYSPSICPVMVGDETIGGLANKTLPEGKSASVRFMWNEETNATGRSYLKSAQGPRNARFLVLHGAADDMIFNNDATGTAIPASGDLAKNEKIFEDTENWVYECYIKAKPGAKVSLIAKYNELDRYLIGGPSSWETIIDGTGDSKYIMKVVYDFKTNRLMTAWTPTEGITDKLRDIDVIIERHNQDGATTITFKKATEESEAGSIEAKSVIGALRFDYDELVGRVASWTPDTRAKMMFLVSFPFDVNISDIFGLNTNYGEAFIVQQYNGAKRAEKGFFQLDGTDTFWETLPVDSVMHAGVGYCVCMDNDYLNNDVGHLWDNKKAGSSIYLYFPSANGDIVINSDAKTIHVPAHECKINRTFNGGKLNHKYTDSNWNMMGIPIFQNHTGDKDAAGTPGAIFTPDKDPSDTTDYKPGIGFFYKWSTDKSYSVQKAQGYVFKPMHGYLVQYAGDVTFTCAAPVVASVVARRTPLEEDYELELQVLNTSEEVLNRTYVELREEACDTFALNEDLYLAMNKHDVNVYTFAGTYNVAANVLSVDNHIVPMGVVVRKEGTYTFSMPDNFSGEVILVDKSAQTRTNLAMTDYEIHLPAGTIDDRFELEININKVPTAIDGVTDGQGSLKDGKAHKFIMNDQMYILKDGLLYDARGNRVK